MEQKFLNLNLGAAKTTSVPMQTVDVTINCGQMMRDYAHAFISEAFRINPLRAERVALTEDELTRYFQYLMTKRVEYVADECRDFRLLKVLYLPSFFQFALSLVGLVVLRDEGLTFKPQMLEKSTMTFAEASEISSKVGSFENDLQIVQDAMPRDVHGDKAIMSTALISGYVRSCKPIEHDIFQYICAFLDVTLMEEQIFSILYRQQGEDVATLRMALLSEKGIFR